MLVIVKTVNPCCMAEATIHKSLVEIPSNPSGPEAETGIPFTLAD